MPDERWGEVPVAFVMLRNSGDVDATALADFAREHLARYKVPKRFEFRELPKTSTGKIQKNVLRDMAKQLRGNS
jgi:fatty-acyl-CoA synthase